MAEWTIGFLPDPNNRLFLAALVSYKWFVSINFMFSLKIEKESLLKQLFMKTNFHYLYYQ